MWKELSCNAKIDLRKTLFSGQIFNFKELSNGTFIGNIYDRICILQQRESLIFFFDSSNDIEFYIQRLFNTDINIDSLPESNGLRFVTNDILPTIFSFICSANNNLKRITAMVNFLYSKGSLIEIDLNYLNQKYGQINIDEVASFKVNRFPDLKDLLNLENELKIQKFGYRANFICEASKFLIEHKIDWANLSYIEARKQLLAIKGVGRKVADCICLISLKFFDVVPLDTHIFRISQKEFNIETQSLTDKLYLNIQMLWRLKYGEFAGIVQLYRFKESLDSQPGRKKIKTIKN